MNKIPICMYYTKEGIHLKEIGGIPIVISRGTSYEIGLNHGKSHPDRVQRSFEYNLKSCIKESTTCGLAISK